MSPRSKSAPPVRQGKERWEKQENPAPLSSVELLAPCTKRPHAGPAKCWRSLESLVAQFATMHRPRAPWQKPARNSTHTQEPSSAQLITVPYSPPPLAARNDQQKDHCLQDAKQRHHLASSTRTTNHSRSD